MTTTMESAIIVRNAFKTYGNKNVLNDLNMTVPRGSIYGLLGASGCGKTTLLSCIVGSRMVDSGDIFVLGKRPPGFGSLIGYMPQDIALIGELTVKDCAYYFGTIYGMTKEEVDVKYDFLENLLQLPPRHKFVRNLSGGQQRRASLAVSLIHDADILILDEPTVGLDPVLRQNIWDHLLELTANGVTIIITTHYIEEAKKAHMIGLMREGQLLEEGTPNELLIKYNSTTIETVFLKLCADQDSGIVAADRLQGSYGGLENVMQEMKPHTLEMKVMDDGNILQKRRYQSTSTMRTKALLKKNALRLVRNSGSSRSLPQLRIEKLTLDRVELSHVLDTLNLHPRRFDDMLPCPKSESAHRYDPSKDKNEDLGLYDFERGLLFSFVLPLLEITTFYLTVGRVPQTLHLGIINREFPTGHSCAPGGLLNLPPGTQFCEFSNLSCAFLGDFKNTVETHYYFEYFDTKEEAMVKAKQGHFVAVVEIGPDFSSALLERFNRGKDSSDDALRDSEVNVYIDMSDGQMGHLFQLQVYETYNKFASALLKACGADPRVPHAPIRFLEPVYGVENATYGEYITPGVISTLIYFLSITLTSIIIIVEREEGIWSRSLVAGVSTNEILVSHIVTQSLIMILQTIEVIIVSFFGFRFRCSGHYFSVALLLLFQGFCGLCSGLAISVFSNTVTSSNLLATGSFMPIISLSGSIWPLEGMPTFLRWIALAMPTTLTTQAVRDVMERGWNSGHPNLLISYGVSFFWSLMFMVLSCIKLNRKGYY